MAGWYKRTCAHKDIKRTEVDLIHQSFITCLIICKTWTWIIRIRKICFFGWDSLELKIERILERLDERFELIKSWKIWLMNYFDLTSQNLDRTDQIQWNLFGFYIRYENKETIIFSEKSGILGHGEGSFIWLRKDGTGGNVNQFKSFKDDFFGEQ